MGKILHLTALLMLVILLGCSENSSTNGETETEIQDGTAEHPYLIKTKQDLMQMRDRVNNENAIYANKVYKLMADIDFAGESSWVPIGLEGKDFRGIFDGNGKVIRNIRIGDVGVKANILCAGLFGKVSNGEIRNLGVYWKILNSADSGGILGIANGCNIANCHSHGSIFGSVAGGIILEAKDCNISNCFTDADIVSDDASYGFVGGIAGNMVRTVINNCYASGKTSSRNNAGGIAGNASDGAILNCYSSGLIITSDAYSLRSGGIVAIANNNFIINCYSTGDITSRDGLENTGALAGGIVGLSTGGVSILNCYSSGNILSSNFKPNGGAQSGGILGALSVPSGTVNNCIALNSGVTAVATNYFAAGRIVSVLSNNASNVYQTNYALPSLVVKSGTSSSTLTTITTFTNTKTHGVSLSSNPKDLLNSYVSTNPSHNGIGLSKWKVQTGVNNGNPIFDK